MSEPQWEDLQQAWQEPPSAQLPKLEKLLKRRSRIIWAMTAIDALGTALLLAGLVWFMRRESTPTALGWSAFVAVVLVLVWGAVLLIRRGTWRADMAAPAEMVRLSIRRCRASIRLAMLNQYALLVMLVLALAIRTAGIAAPRMEFEVTLLMRLGAMAFVVGLFVVAEWYKRRKQAELERLKALQEELPTNSTGARPN